MCPFMGTAPPPPRSCAYCARSNVCLLHVHLCACGTVTYYLYNSSGLGGLLVSVLLRVRSLFSLFRCGACISCRSSGGILLCRLRMGGRRLSCRSVFCGGWVGDGLSSVAGLSLPPSVAGLSGSVFSALPVLLVSSALLRTAERSSGYRSL